MNKFSHFKWYEVVIYALFSFYCLKMIVEGIDIFKQTSNSLLIPIYAKFLLFIPSFVEVIIGLISVLGLIYLFSAKKGGWSLLFFGSLTLSLLSFIPFHKLPYDYHFGGNYFALIFLSVPLVLFVRKAHYHVASKHAAFIFVAVCLTLFLQFFSFDIFLVFQ